MSEILIFGLWWILHSTVQIYEIVTFLLTPDSGLRQERIFHNIPEEFFGLSDNVLAVLGIFQIGCIEFATNQFPVVPRPVEVVSESEMALGADFVIFLLSFDPRHHEFLQTINKLKNMDKTLAMNFLSFIVVIK